MFFSSGVKFNVLERSLDAATLRQRVVSNNIANVDTPFFKRSDVRFEEMLQEELYGTKSTLRGYRTHPKHFPIGSTSASGTAQAEITTDQSSQYNNNKNNVDIDYEMALLAKNQLRYNLLVQQTSHEIKQIRTAIGGRV